MISPRSPREISLRWTDRAARSDCFHNVSLGELYVGGRVLCRKSRTAPCCRTLGGIRVSLRTARFSSRDFAQLAARSVSTAPRKPRSASIGHVAIRRRLGVQAHFHPCDNHTTFKEQCFACLGFYFAKIGKSPPGAKVAITAANVVLCLGDRDADYLLRRFVPNR